MEHPLPFRRNRPGEGPARAPRNALSQEQKQQKQQNRPAAILDLACDPEPVIRSRILAVVEYLRKIQEK